MESFRQLIEESILTLPHVRPVKESDRKFIDDFKDGTFGLSYLGFLLYCNGLNPRGLSTYPNGLRYFDGERIFGIGIFRRERDDQKGHLMIVAPRGAGVIGCVNNFAAKCVSACPQLAGQLLYVRFLSENQYVQLIKSGYSPVQEEPWHSEAYAEDETFNHSIVALDELFGETSGGIDLRKVHQSTRNKDAVLRFENFLKRHGLEWKVTSISSVEHAKEIINDHFQMLEKLGKKIGSTSEDYWGLLEDCELGDFSCMFRIRKNERELSAAVFVGEKISPNRIALYCTIARRDPAIYSKELGIPEDSVGFTALSTYAFLSALRQVKLQLPEITQVHLGGSETADLNSFKRRLGARNEPTYWCVKKL